MFVSARQPLGSLGDLSGLHFGSLVGVGTHAAAVSLWQTSRGAGDPVFLGLGVPLAGVRGTGGPLGVACAPPPRGWLPQSVPALLGAGLTRRAWTGVAPDRACSSQDHGGGKFRVGGCWPCLPDPARLLTLLSAAVPSPALAPVLLWARIQSCSAAGITCLPAPRAQEACPSGPAAEAWGSLESWASCQPSPRQDLPLAPQPLPPNQTEAGGEGVAGLGSSGQSGKGRGPSQSPIFRGAPGSEPPAASLASAEVRGGRRGAALEAPWAVTWLSCEPPGSWASSPTGGCLSRRFLLRKRGCKGMGTVLVRTDSCC